MIIGKSSRIAWHRLCERWLAVRQKGFVHWMNTKNVVLYGKDTKKGGQHEISILHSQDQIHN